VLVVDDEIDVLNTVQSYLSEKGYKTLGCTSGKGALEALKKYDFDLLLADLTMPEINGIQLLQSALEIDPHLIGIIITGKGTNELPRSKLRGVTNVIPAWPESFFALLFCSV